MSTDSNREPFQVVATASWQTGPSGRPVCSRPGCDARSTRRVILLDPDGTPQPLGHDDYCRRHARELASGLRHYGPGRPGFRVEVLR